MTDPTRPVAVVTGASSGIGTEFAGRYAREGYDVVLVARSARTLDELATRLRAEHGVEVTVRPADLGRADEVAALAHDLVHALPRLDHLVNCAGVALWGEHLEHEDDAVRAMIDVNVTALTVLTGAAVRRMRPARRGTIVNVGSVGAFHPMPYLAAYGATKSYVVSFTEAVQEENRRHGLHLLALSPGETETPMNPGAGRAKRSAAQVVDTAFRSFEGSRSSVVDGRTNRVLAVVLGRALPRSIGMPVVGRVMRGRH